MNTTQTPENIQKHRSKQHGLDKHMTSLTCWSLVLLLFFAHTGPPRIGSIHSLLGRVTPGCEAASSSGAIGSHFPVWSRGILPQISGFLFIGRLRSKQKVREDPERSGSVGVFWASGSMAGSLCFGAWKGENGSFPFFYDWNTSEGLFGAFLSEVWGLGIFGWAALRSTEALRNTVRDIAAWEQWRCLFLRWMCLV